MNNKLNIENDEISIGQYLIQVRESIGFTREQMASQLCLKISTILDIEENTNINNIDPVFLRGYIRAYGKLLKISEEKINYLLDKNIPIKSILFSSTQNYFFKKLLIKKKYCLKKIIWLIITISIVIIYIWWLHKKI